MNTLVLKRPTLVLNRNWVPISTVSVQDALKMLFGAWVDDHGKTQPKARVLDPTDWQTYTWDSWSQLRPRDDEPLVIRSARSAFRVPEIIIATRYKYIPKNQLNFNRRNLLKRDMSTCQYCGRKLEGDEWSVDHVTPRAQGGKSNWDNCVISCLRCNQKKRNRTPEEANMKLLRKPVKPGLEILANNPVKIKSWEIFFGRATVEDVINEAYWSVPLQT